ncbi:MAG: cytochrome P450, partial [Candidatus Dormibacteraeota bacterium]|nr:cytochrome P450 [Candidatus Dormibacteraeota bacterium]
DTPINAGFDTTIASGLLTSEGEAWKRQRSLMQPYFSRRRVPAFADAVAAHFDQWSVQWDHAAARGESIDYSHAMSTFTFRVTAATLFHCDTSAWDGRLVSILTDALPVLTDLSAEPFRLAQRVLGGHASDVVAERLAAPVDDDLFGRLRTSESEESTEDALWNHVTTMLLAGYETTASVITWGSCLLATHPEVCDELARHIRAVAGDRALTHEDLPGLPLLTAVIKETMRLYPPAWIIGRRAIDPDVIGDVEIPAQSVVAVSPYTLHRHPRYWDQPEVFEPRRFMNDEVERRREPFSYIPFGAGPRTCIGSNLALVEAPLVIGRVVQRYRLTLENEGTIAPRGIFVLVPSEAIRMRLTPR